MDSECYPKTTFENCVQYHLNNEMNPDLKLPIKLQQLEIQYIRTCRNQEQKSLKGILNRSEFIEYIVRVAKSAYPTMDSALSIQIVISSYLEQTSKDSKIEATRQLIRDNMPLNKLLFENKHGLDYIFRKHTEHTPGFEK